MIRIPFKDPFYLRIRFLDLDNDPVSLDNTDVDMHFFTRTQAPSYHAHIKNNNMHNVERLDVSTLLVTFDKHLLPPGKLNANIIVKGIMQAQGQQPSSLPVPFDFHPEVPIELVDRWSGARPKDPYHDHSCEFGDHIPTIICRFNRHGVKFVKLITDEDLEHRLDNLTFCTCPDEFQMGEEADIEDILKNFAIPD